MPPVPLTLDQALGQCVRQARKDAGLTQPQAAQLLGRVQSFVSNTETGKQGLKVSELFTLARLYKRPVSWFIEECITRTTRETNSASDDDKQDSEADVDNDAHETHE